MKTNRKVLYVFIALLFCCALVHDIENNSIEIENKGFYKNYEVNNLYLHENTAYYDIEINKMPIKIN